MNILKNKLVALAPWIYCALCWAAIVGACFNTAWLWLFLPAAGFAALGAVKAQTVLIFGLFGAPLAGAQNIRVLGYNPPIHDTTRADAVVIDTAGTFGDGLILYKELICVSIYDVIIVDGMGKNVYGDFKSRTFYRPDTWAIVPEEKILTYKLKR